MNCVLKEVQQNSFNSECVGMGRCHMINNTNTDLSSYRCLTFRVLCIVIYSYNKSQRDAPFLKFILIKNSTCYGQ